MSKIPRMQHLSPFEVQVKTTPNNIYVKENGGIPHWCVIPTITLPGLSFLGLTVPTEGKEYSSKFTSHHSYLFNHEETILCTKRCFMPKVSHVVIRDGIILFGKRKTKLYHWVKPHYNTL